MNWANWRDLIHELYQLRTYWSLVPSPTNKRPMIVTLEDTQPFPCKSADEWIKTGVQLGKKFPVGWFTVKRDKPLESFNDAFFTHSFRYSKIPFGELIAKFESVKPSHRNWTGIVVPGVPTACRLRTAVANFRVQARGFTCSLISTARST